jgi:BirA family biotin operon repressor/biotin-[acetyl-CoA-carboxylase] ligase
MTMNIIWLQEVDSTNKYAAQQLADAADKTVWAAHAQTAGRGQQSAKWESEPFKNLTFSLLLRPVWLPADEQFYISKAVSVGVVRFLQRHGLSASVKWPNDIYVGDKKIAGILIENHVGGNVITGSVVGVGLNVNQQKFVSDAPNPTSIWMENGVALNLQEALPELVTCILQGYEQLRNGDTQSIDDEYLVHLYRLNEWHWFAADCGKFRAKITGVRRSGKLLLLTENGETRPFVFKEVKFV